MTKNDTASMPKITTNRTITLTSDRPITLDELTSFLTRLDDEFDDAPGDTPLKIEQHDDQRDGYFLRITVSGPA